MAGESAPIVCFTPQVSVVARVWGVQPAAPSGHAPSEHSVATRKHQVGSHDIRANAGVGLAGPSIWVKKVDAPCTPETSFVPLCPFQGATTPTPGALGSEQELCSLPSRVPGAAPAWILLSLCVLIHVANCGGHWGTFQVR